MKQKKRRVINPALLKYNLKVIISLLRSQHPERCHHR